MRVSSSGIVQELSNNTQKRFVIFTNDEHTHTNNIEPTRFGSSVSEGFFSDDEDENYVIAKDKIFETVCDGIVFRNTE